MTRIFTEGFELGDGAGWSYVYAIGAAGAHTGSYGLTLHYNNEAILSLSAEQSEVYFRCWLKGPYFDQVFWDTEYSPLGIHIEVDGTTRKISARMTYPNTTFGTGDIVLQEGQWYLLEWHWKPDSSGSHPNGTDGVFELRIDGIEQISFTGETSPYLAGNHLTTMRDMAFTGLTTTTSYMDDIAINNASGLVDNSWCGDGRITAIFPTSTTSEEWTSSSVGDNHLMVDEKPQDGDTTYIEALTAGLTDQYGMGTFTIPANHEVSRVWVEARGKANIPDGTGKVALGVVTNSGSDQSTAQALTTSYTTNRILSEEWIDNPVTATAWTQSDIDGLEVTVESAD